MWFPNVESEARNNDKSETANRNPKKERESQTEIAALCNSKLDDDKIHSEKCKQNKLTFHINS